MITVNRHHREFQVGTLKRRDSEVLGLVVLNPLHQPANPGTGFISLYEHAENRISDFRAEVVLKLIGRPDQFPRTEIEQVVDAYCRASGVDPEAEWLKNQRMEAGRSVGVSGYAALRERYGDQQIPYEKLLSTPEWLERRALILDRDGRCCAECGFATAADGGRFILQVHHRYYVRGSLPWEYPDEALSTLCLACHGKLHEKELVPVYDVIDGRLVRITWRPCIRCLGAGFLPQYTHLEGGVCFRCWGTRFDVGVFDVATGQRRTNRCR